MCEIQRACSHSIGEIEERTPRKEVKERLLPYMVHGKKEKMGMRDKDSLYQLSLVENIDEKIHK